LKLTIISLFFYICLYTSNVFSQKIAVINIENLIDNNVIYNETLKDMELSQKKFLNNFNIRENELKSLLVEIEESKLILSENEINLKIFDYNNQLSEFTMQVEKFNLHYQNEINIMKEFIFKEILILLEKYAIKNNIDLIIDSNSYLIASTSLDITNLINKELDNISLKLEYKNFENN
tara:strand:- start:357 stop:890 length:534 start_codon:yes stop_codon:yes gene_type:complete